MTREQRTTISAVRLKACAALVPSVSDVSAKGKRARVSADLEAQLQAGDNTDTSVIVTGTKAKVDAIAKRHGLRISKRLKSGAVLNVPAGSLAALTDDSDVDALSGNYRLQAHMGVTTVAIGADQVWEDGWAAGEAGVTGEGVVVAVIDSGVANVKELRDRILVSMDFTATSKGKGQRVRRPAKSVTPTRAAWHLARRLSISESWMQTATASPATSWARSTGPSGTATSTESV